MQAICGFLRLDGQPASAADAARLRTALVYHPQPATARFDGCVAGQIALGTAAWGGHSCGGDASPVAHHAETGCVVVADARLDCCADLARRLDLPAESAPTQAELILHAWLRWGDRCAEELRGDFAFALWDRRTQRLFCARDIMGVRPLHVHHQPGRLFAFASRARALLVLPDVPPDLDDGRIADALTADLEGVDKTCTFYRAIERLPPAHALTLAPEGCRVRRHWRLEPGRVVLPRNDAGWAEALTEVLGTAIARHLDGAARVGSMVSGGMDSSSLAVLAAAQRIAARHDPLPTFSSLDSAADDPETRAVLEMSRLPGFRPTLLESAVLVAQGDTFAELAWDSEEPFDTNMLLAHAQYRAAAATNVDAVIDGNDGDVLFSDGGVLARQLRQLRWLGMVRNLRGQARTFPGMSVPATLAGLVRGAIIPGWARRWRNRVRGPRHAQARVQDELAHGIIAPAFAQRVDLAARFARLAAWRQRQRGTGAGAEALTRLDHPFTTCGFERYHRVAARHGVDPRHPFADRDVLELLVNLPDRQRIRDGWTKACLREAMRGHLPEPVRTRRGKEHLGWDLVERILLPSATDARRFLAERHDLLEPYLDAHKLDAALAHWADPGAKPGKIDLLMALGLGHWLERHAAVLSRRREAVAADTHLAPASPRGSAP